MWRRWISLVMAAFLLGAGIGVPSIALAGSAAPADTVLSAADSGPLDRSEDRNDVSGELLQDGHALWPAHAAAPATCLTMQQPARPAVAGWVQPFIDGLQRPPCAAA